MTAMMQLAARPTPAVDDTKKSRYRTVGLTLAIIGLMGATISVIANFVAAGGIDQQNSFAETLAWTFGVSIFSFGVIKIAIAVILMGIVVRLWQRVDAIKSSLVELHGHSKRLTDHLAGVVVEARRHLLSDGALQLRR